MAGAQRAVRYVLMGIAVVGALIVGLAIVLTRTDFGVERAGGFALDRIRGSINGELTVERITSGGLLSGVTLHDVAITGPDGRPFVSADSARLAYSLRTLLGGSIVFNRLIVYAPDVTIERLPGSEEWNFDRIFPGDTTPQPDTTTRGLVLIDDATIHGGRVTVRQPWEPDGAVAPDDTARLILEEVPGGVVRTLRFEEVDARLPRIVWEAPDQAGKIFRIERLAARAYVWETPARIEDLEGVVAVRDSLVSFEASRARLPSSELSLVGRVILADEGNRYDIEVESDDVAFEDLQWLYPPIPAEGGGSFRFRLQTQDPGSILWLFRDADIETRGTRLAGSFGVVTGDTLFFTNVDLEASPLDLELLQSLLPGELPLEGLLIGTVELEGPISSLRTRGNLRHRDPGGESATVRWAGVIGGAPPYAMRDVEAVVDQLSLEDVARLAPGLRLRGTASGHVRASGSLREGLEVVGDLVLDQAGRRSSIRGEGRFAVGGDRSAFDLRFDAEPVALELLAEQFPVLEGLGGEAVGPVTVTGSLDDLVVDADITTPAGDVLLQGRFALTDSVPRYRAEGAVRAFQVDRVMDRVPVTTITGSFDLEGEGRALETMNARLNGDLEAARVSDVQVHRGTVRASLAGGLVRVDSLAVDTEVGRARAGGSFGVVEGRRGELAIEVVADSLLFLEPVLLGDAPPGDLGVRQEPRLGGRVDLDGSVTGSVEDWELTATVAGRGLRYEDLEVDRSEIDLVWRPDSVSLDGTLDSLDYGGRRLAHALATVQYADGSGTVVARARGLPSQQLDVESAFERLADGGGVRLQVRQLGLTTQDGQWALADTASARIGSDGLEVDGLVLVRGPHHARVRLAGVLPWQQPGDARSHRAAMTLALDSVRLGEMLQVAQADSLVDGVFTGTFRVTGTAMAPVLVGGFWARPFRYGGAVLDSARADVTYRDRMVRGEFSGWQNGDAIVSGSGTVPMRLELTDVEQRLADEPMDVRITADRVPAGLVAFLAPGFREVDGLVDGELALVGTPRSPGLEGTLRLVDGSAYFEPLAVRFRQIDATASMGTGSVVEIAAQLATQSGRGQVAGTLDLARPGDPRFDLELTARRLDASRRRDVTAVADGTIRVGGSYTRPVLSGDLRLVRGEMNLDEIWRQYQIVQLDSTLFQVLDTTTVSYRPPADIPFLENLRITNTTVVADRDFWLRSRELSVEVSGSLGLEVDRQEEELLLTGTLEALGGHYDLLAQDVPGGRRFDIRSGTIEFVGTPGIDPNLAIEAAYRVRRAQGDPIDVIARVSGTLQDPRVELTSDSDLPMTQTDLASYILFGRAGAELTPSELDIAATAGGLVRPMVTGLASTELQNILVGTGLPVDYVALSVPESEQSRYGYGSALGNGSGWGGLFRNTQLEVGFDASSDVSVIGSVRLLEGESGQDQSAALWALRRVGARVEWRMAPTWTVEGFIEDRFARTPSFGLSEIDDRKVWGLSLFREWGY
jgi:hypothetical protein